MTEQSEKPLFWHMEQFLYGEHSNLAERSTDSYRTNLRDVLRCLAVVLDTKLAKKSVSVVDDAAKALNVEVLTVDNLRAAFVKVQAGAFRSRDVGEPRSPGSMRIVWACVNGLCTHLTQQSVLPGNPMSGVDNPEPVQYQPTALRENDARALLKAAAEPPRRNLRIRWPLRDVAIIGTGMVLGARASEITSLTVGAIRGRPGATFMELGGSGLNLRTLPVPVELEDALVRYLDDRVTGAPRTGKKPVLSRGRQPDSFSAHPWWRIVKSERLFVTTAGEPMDRIHLFSVVRRVYVQAGLTEKSHGSSGVLRALRNTFIYGLREAGTSRDEMESLLGYMPPRKGRQDYERYRPGPIPS